MKRNLHITQIFFISSLVVIVLFILKLAFSEIHIDSPKKRFQSSHIGFQNDPNPVASKTNVQNNISSENTSFKKNKVPIPKEGIISFKDEKYYLAFLDSIERRKLNLIGNSKQLKTVRVGFDFFEQIEAIEGAEVSPNYPVFIPSPPSTNVQNGAQSFGANALESVGIFRDNSDWGTGVTVAVIDSGVNQHIALNDEIKKLALTELPDESKQLGHGTAVASIISGNHPLTKGVAPSAEIVSIRITDDMGLSNSFTLAEGILAAVDQGAQIINISMGSEGDSSIVYDAVNYAQQRGAVIVASAGNDGYDSLSFPAAYPGVISVGAIEANGNHLNFSNTAKSLSIVAPGYGVNAAWGENLMTSFTGTSASAPFMSGAIAAVISENPGYTARQAADLLLKLANEAGEPDIDEKYGNGILDVGRALENGQSGIYDIAVTGQYIDTSETNKPELNVVIQNQGTETLFNSPIRIETPNGTRNISINSLVPSQTYIAKIPLLPLKDDQTTLISSSASTGRFQDIQLNNNSRENLFSQNKK